MALRHRGQVSWLVDRRRGPAFPGRRGDVPVAPVRDRAWLPTHSGGTVPASARTSAGTGFPWAAMVSVLGV